MVMMNQDGDFMELLFSEPGDFLTMNGEVIPPVSESTDQRLDLDFTQLPDMDILLSSDTEDPCLKPSVSDTPDVQPTSNAVTSTSLAEQEANFIFQFPSTSHDLDFTDSFVTVETDGSFLADLTDTESTVISTPFSPGSPFSLPPATPDTASSSSDSVFGMLSTSSSSSSTPNPNVKLGLRNRIRSKRAQEGKGDIKVEFKAPEPETLTEEEEARRIEKREKNKLAAQKCREKKRQVASVLEDEIKGLEKKQSQFELDIQKLIEERDHLRDIISVHGSVCHSFRAHTSGI